MKYLYASPVSGLSTAAGSNSFICLLKRFWLLREDDSRLRKPDFSVKVSSCDTGSTEVLNSKWQPSPRGGFALIDRSIKGTF